VDNNDDGAAKISNHDVASCGQASVRRTSVKVVDKRIDGRAGSRSAGVPCSFQAPDTAKLFVCGGIVRALGKKKKKKKLEYIIVLYRTFS
jgi:hypothetical protein